MFSGRRIIVDAAKGRGSPALFFAGDHGKAGIWVTEERNVYEDRRALFGEDPPTIGAVSSDDRHGQHGRGGGGVLRGHHPRTGAVSPGGYRFFSLRPGTLSRCGGFRRAACGARKKSRRAEPAASGRRSRSGEEPPASRGLPGMAPGRPERSRAGSPHGEPRTEPPPRPRSRSLRPRNGTRRCGARRRG